MDAKLLEVLKLLSEQVLLVDDIAVLRLLGHERHKHADAFDHGSLRTWEENDSEQTRTKVIRYEDNQRKLFKLLEKLGE